MPSSSVLALKRQALEFKKAGDIEGAKDALRKAKKLEQEEKDQAEQQQQQQQQQQQAEGPQEDAHTTERGSEDGTSAAAPQRPCDIDPVNQAIDAANLEELKNDKQVTFTDEELLDMSMMADLKGAGIDIPSQEFYHSRILNWKRAALASKNAKNIPEAKQHLSKSKAIEKAMNQLYGDVKEPQLEDDDEGFSPDDLALLQELKQIDQYEEERAESQQDDGFMEQLFGTSTTVLELEDLDDIDASMLKDMIDAGMQVPDPVEILKQAEDKKIHAIAFKKQGNLEAAKAALQESKRLQQKGNQLQGMLNQIQNSSRDEKCDELDLNDPDALEAMFAEESKPRKAPPPPAEKPQPNPKLKSSQEYKIEAVKFKHEGKKEEAIAALRLYKEALTAEQKVQVLQQRKEMIQSLESEIPLAAEQARMFSFYKLFVDQQVGHAQLAAWDEYHRKCLSRKLGLEIMEEDDAKSNELLQRDKEGALLAIHPRGDLSFVGNNCDPNDDRIEITILEMVNLQNNKSLISLLTEATNNDKIEYMPSPSSIRVVVTVHLPLSAGAQDDGTTQVLDYKPSSKAATTAATKGWSYHAFGSSQYISTERGSTRFAKLLLRRLTRRRCVTIEVFYLSTVKSKGGFFAIGSNTTTTETLIGSASMELKDFVETDTNCIALDLPLLDTGRRKPMGGFLRIAIRTGRRFQEGGEGVGNKSHGVEHHEEGHKSIDPPATGLSATGILKKYSPFILLEE